MSFSGEENTVRVEDFLELLEIFLEGLDTQISDTAWHERAKVLVVKAYEKPKPQVQQTQLPNQNKFEGSYLQRAQTQSARDQTPYTQNSDTYPYTRDSVIYVEHLSDEDLGLAPETDQTPYTRDSVIYVEHLSDEDLGLVVPETKPMEKNSVTYIEYLSEDMGLVPETASVLVGMVTTTDELVKPMKKTSVTYIELSDKDMG
ncbi:hypothetical protein L211DRAFT_890344 [Terfezia boudieri ATCC MYA-4762]|uniref:Uncharacterized protein n=1 Tax=Terfezia boudieri ATCC MYA-4762 TaxID=1051890 RepID=A0A3N4LE24_9PEZI|nr:hypothetical protein L211DRAFT_890344 [Terfezia boudieri ATCC MYA-4762]